MCSSWSTDIRRPRRRPGGDGRVWLGGLSVGEPIRLAVDSASLPDAFLAPAAPEIVVQPRPGRAFRLEIPVVETGEIAGVAELIDDAQRVAAQAGVPLSIGVTDASPDCEFLLTITPASRDFATSFTVVADRISVLEGTLLNSNPGNREWLVRMTSGVARVAVGGVLQMNTSADLFDSYAATFTVSAAPP